MALTETTKISAINTMLSCIGESPVSSLEAAATADVSIALNILDEVCRDLCSRDWAWNNLTKQTLTKNVSGKIAVPAAWVRVDHPTKNVAKRGGFLYNREDSTDVFTADMEDLTAVVLLDWEDMPESARRYAMIRAGRTLVARVVGSEKGVAFTERDESQAWMTLREYESEQSDLNIFNNADVASNLRRWA